MPKTNARPIDGGQYLCARCDHSFGSIAELRDHEKLCKGASRLAETKAAQTYPQTAAHHR